VGFLEWAILIGVVILGYVAWSRILGYVAWSRVKGNLRS